LRIFLGFGFGDSLGFVVGGLYVVSSGSWTLGNTQ
jgi:hypothetical protein